jgi:hypothetical protein
MPESASAYQAGREQPSRGSPSDLGLVGFSAVGSPSLAEGGGLENR